MRIVSEKPQKPNKQRLIIKTDARWSFTKNSGLSQNPSYSEKESLKFSVDVLHGNFRESIIYL